MKLISYFTPSHHRLFDSHLSPSLEGKGFEIVPLVGDQYTELGTFYSKGWGATVKVKLDLLREFAELETEPFVFADPDIATFDFTPEDVLRHLSGTLDVIAQRDNHFLCTGFMFIRPSRKIADCFEEAKSLVKDNNGDQPSFNSIVAKRASIYTALLPEAYTCPLYACGGHWRGQSLQLPKGMKMFHANWCVGVDAKDRLLTQVKEAYQCRLENESNR